MITIVNYLIIAIQLPSTTYGFGEKMCGDPGRTRACEAGAMTASGEIFNPSIASAAIPMPYKVKMKSFYIKIRNYLGNCVKIKVNDKKNERYIGNSGLDLSPAAQQIVTGKIPSKTWSGKVEVCKEYGRKGFGTLHGFEFFNYPSKQAS